MTRRRYPDPISNQYFSLLDGTRARVRVCRHNDRPIMVGIQYHRPVTGGLGWERMLLPDGKRAKQLFEIAAGIDGVPLNMATDGDMPF